MYIQVDLKINRQPYRLLAEASYTVLCYAVHKVAQMVSKLMVKRPVRHMLWSCIDPLCFTEPSCHQAMLSCGQPVQSITAYQVFDAFVVHYMALICIEWVQE